jgi:chromosome segregation ATPase
MTQVESSEARRGRREERLEELLDDANRQLLDRDDALAEIIQARESEIALTRERLAWAERELERHVRQVESLNRAISEVQASRAWRLAEQYRRLRNRVRGILSA